MKRFLNWMKPVASAICWMRHGWDWEYVRHAGEIDDDIGEYFCPRCEKTRFKREWL